MLKREKKNTSPSLIVLFSQAIEFLVSGQATNNLRSDAHIFSIRIHLIFSLSLNNRTGGQKRMKMKTKTKTQQEEQQKEKKGTVKGRNVTK